MADRIEAIMRAAPVIPVLAISRLSDAVPLARALCEGGLRVLEITLRTDVAEDVIAAIAREVPDAIVGAGTVRRPDDLARVARVGARFAVSPGLTPPLVEAAQSSPIPLLPGVATASEIMAANDAGFSHLKFFPAESSGGLAAIRSFAGPFPDVRFCPTGGIDREKAAAYLAEKTVLCVGGSWIAPKDLVASGDWIAIGRLAAEAAALGD